MASGSGWNIWVWLAGGGWNLWLWLVGAVVRRYIDFLILLTPAPLVYALFCSSIPTFCSFLNVFRSLIIKLTTVKTKMTQNYNIIASISFRD